jgi:hypothetical protein
MNVQGIAPIATDIVESGVDRCVAIGKSRLVSADRRVPGRPGTGSARGRAPAGARAWHARAAHERAGDRTDRDRHR